MQPRVRRAPRHWSIWSVSICVVILSLLASLQFGVEFVGFRVVVAQQGGGISNNTGPPAFVKIGALFQLTGAGANGTSPRYQQDHPLPLSSYTGVYTDLSMGFAAFKFQLNQLNSDASLLPQTQLVYEHYDDQGSPQGGFFGALHLVQNGATVLIGAATSLTSANAEIVANNFDIPIVSYASTSPVLSEKRTYPTFLRVCHSEALTATAMVYTMRNQFNWDNIAILYQDSVYGNTADYFIKTASSLNMTVTVSVPFRFGASVDEFITPMTRLRESGSKIFVFLGLPLDWRAAIKAGKIVGNIFTNDTAWMVDDALTLNLPSDLLSMAPGLLSITPARDDSSPEYQDWVTKFLNRPVAPDENPIETFTATKDQLSFYIAFIADSVSVVAHALHDLIEVQQKYDFTPHDIQLAIASSNFTGISGQVSFDANYDRLGITFQLKNLQGTSWKTIARWDPSKPAELDFLPDAPPILFFDGTSNVPGVNHIGTDGQDGNVKTSMANSDPVFYSFILVPVVTIVLLLLSAAVIFFCRNTRVIHVASPLMLELIVFGAILVCLSVLISAFPQSVTRCTTKPFFFHIGFQFSIGSMMLKSYRLHRIFNNKELTTARFNRFYPVWFVILGVLVDSTFLTIRSALNPYQLEVLAQCTLERRWSGGNYDKLISVLTGFLLFEKVLIILWGVWLSYKVRNLPTLYNESSFLAYATWNLLLLYSTYLGVKYGVDISNPEAQLTFENVLLMTSVISTCGLIFVPKFIDLYASEKHRFYFNRLRGQMKKRAALDRKIVELAAVANSSRKDAAANRSRNNGEQFHTMAQEEEYQLKSDSDEESPAQRGDPKSVKDIMSILQLIQEHNVRHLDRAISEMQQLKTASRDKKKEIATTNETLYQIRTEQLYYQSVAKNVGDAQVVELFMERMNDFAMMSSVSRESQAVVSSEGIPERGALSRGIVEPRTVGGTLPVLHPPEPARGRRARLAAQGPGSNGALATQKKLYRDVKGAILYDPPGYPSSIAPPYPTPQQSMIRQSSAPQPYYSRRSASREKMRQSQLQQQHQQQMMHLYQTNELMQLENRSQLLSEVPVEERSAEEEGEETVHVRIEAVPPTEPAAPADPGQAQPEPPPMCLTSMKRTGSSSNTGSRGNSPRSRSSVTKQTFAEASAKASTSTMAELPEGVESKSATKTVTEGAVDVDEAATATEVSSPSSETRRSNVPSHVATEDSQPFASPSSNSRAIRVHVNNNPEPDLRATPPFLSEEAHELAAPIPSPSEPSPDDAVSAAVTPADSSTMEAAASRTPSLSSAKDDHPTFDALDTVP